MKKIYLETFGCQMNVLDSELVENQLAALGYRFTPAIEDADVVLYNTCSVRERSEQKVWSRLGLLKMRKAEDPSLVVGVIGCMAERDGVGLMKRMPHVDLMCGPSELDQLPALLDNVLKTGKQQHALAGNTSRRSKTLEQRGRARMGWSCWTCRVRFRRLTVNNGIRRIFGSCADATNFARIAWCLIRAGRKFRVHLQAILEEARQAVAAGCLEITLLGQTVNHYVYEARRGINSAQGL